MQSPVHTVRFEPQGRSFRVLQGASLLRAALRARLPLASSCRGSGACQACLVRVLQGAEHLSAPSSRELAAGIQGDERLACMARVHGPVTITTYYW